MHNASAGGQPPTGLSDPSCTNCNGRMCRCLAEAAMRIQTEKLDELLGPGAPRSRRDLNEILPRGAARGRRVRAATSPPPRRHRTGKAEFRLANYYIDLDSQMYYMDPGNDRDMLKLQNDPNVKTRYGQLNLVFAGSIGPGTAGRTWMDQLVNKDATPIAIFGPDANMITVVHEIGHVMGLPHTAGKTPVTTATRNQSSPPSLLLLWIWRLTPSPEWRANVLAHPSCCCAVHVAWSPPARCLRTGHLRPPLGHKLRPREVLPPLHKLRPRPRFHQHTRTVMPGASTAASPMTSAHTRARGPPSSPSVAPSLRSRP